jgi:hypothetical protein
MVTDELRSEMRRHARQPRPSGSRHTSRHAR